MSPPSLTYLPTICRRSIRISSTLHEHSSTLSTSCSEAVNLHIFPLVHALAHQKLPVTSPDHLPPTQATGSRLASLLQLPVLGLPPPCTALSPPRSHSSPTHCRTPPTARPPRRYSVGTPTSATVSQPKVPIRRPSWTIRSVSARAHAATITPARPHPITITTACPHHTTITSARPRSTTDKGT